MSPLLSGFLASSLLLISLVHHTWGVSIQQGQKTASSPQRLSEGGPITSVTRSGKGASLVAAATAAAAAPCPGGQTYCDAAPDYPGAHIKNLLKKQPRYVLNQFNLEEDLSVEDDLHDKGSFGGTEQPLCVSEPKIIYPQKAKARDGAYEFVINDDEYKQGVKIETCSNKSNAGGCRLPGGGLPLDYSSHCAQKHILRSLVVLDRSSADGAGFVTRPFEFPSCCSCIVVRH